MIKVSEFKSCIDNPPTKDGTYLVVRMRKNFYIEKPEFSYGAALEYYVGHGWNVHKDIHGHWDYGTRITFEDSPETVWAEVTEEEE